MMMMMTMVSCFRHLHEDTETGMSSKKQLFLIRSNLKKTSPKVFTVCSQQKGYKKYLFPTNQRGFSGFVKN